MAKDSRFKFTTLRLEKLTCPAGKTHAYFYDEEVRGLALYVAATGAMTFYLSKRIGGRYTRLRLGAWPHELSIDAARQEARKASGEVAKGNDPHREKLAARGAMTLGDLFAHHIEIAKQHNKSWEGNEDQYRLHLSQWKGRRLADITRAEVQSLHARVGKNSGRYVANRVLALLHHMYRKTAPNLGYTGPNPAAGVEKFKEKSRERFLNAEELARFFASLEMEAELFRDFFAMALLTGARRANVQGMEWTRINFAEAVWRIPETKSGEAVTVPLVADALAILTRRAESRTGPFVFASRGRTGHLVEPKSAWKRIVERAGLVDVRLHDLRRTFGSWQAAAGVSLNIIGKSMGHKNQSTTAIYARLNVQPVRAAVTTATAAMMQAAKGKGDEKKKD
ncbi:tyrosine-type recombinase/integrase [Limnoglobus roseus]|uniref:Tyrosine recombinase XerC n=1 Tax=Limnoglobus roseus TaxID=2598579 RepID=A0A5C1A8Q5_9BACT|nr:site-specific integrase [Limnoglobus roseus]QEL14657.1 Tyrosine recombinase XerC [Limnoglobus roseus]